MASCGSEDLRGELCIDPRARVDAVGEAGLRRPANDQEVPPHGLAEGRLGEHQMQVQDRAT